jgi:L-asparaginase II
MVNKQGEIIFSVGDTQQVCFPRSALKLFQILPLLESGAVAEFNFTMEEIAIMCGSHNGEKEHLRVVNQILEKIGLSKANLHCGSQYPTLNEDRNEMIKTDRQPEDIHNNCSGKHAGFLAFCVFAGYDYKTYELPDHPLQKTIKRIAAEMHEYDEDKMVTGLDGCSAPIFSLPLYNQALAYKNLTYPYKFSAERQLACKQVIAAMTSYPFMVAGHKRYCTEMMDICGNRIFGKTGADGVYSLGFINENIGCSIKVDDGLMGPQYGVAQEVIERSGIFSKEDLASLYHYIEAPLNNWNRLQTGEQKVNTAVFEGLKELSAYELA